MPTVRGKAETARFFASAPKKLAAVLRGAGRAGAEVVADGIKELTPSEAVRDNLQIRARSDDGRIVVRITVKPGWPRSVGIWLEWGTVPHFISVDDSQRGGRSIGRINRQTKDAGGNHSLVIGGSFVGTTVFHPGAQAHPAFRPALDTKGAAGVAAAKSFLKAHVTRRGIIVPAEPEGDVDG